MRGLELAQRGCGDVLLGIEGGGAGDQNGEAAWRGNRGQAYLGLVQQPRFPGAPYHADRDRGLAAELAFAEILGQQNTVVPDVELRGCRMAAGLHRTMWSRAKVSSCAPKYLVS